MRTKKGRGFVCGITSNLKSATISQGATKQAWLLKLPGNTPVEGVWQANDEKATGKNTVTVAEGRNLKNCSRAAYRWCGAVGSNTTEGERRERARH
jgi:hypothetical protein